ncbi:MAG: alpha/beta fold hydrolase, partial [Thermoanaerobaculia bacterium]|nr:alpha/beta fold hydrolase [Thermoanaerobaculia bacterium]
MNTIESAGGGRIAYDQDGSGPPVLLVHGSISDRSIWEAVRPRLEEHFTVHAVNRRGREESAELDGRVDLEREFLDVAAVVEAIGEPTHVVGHSFGALCSIGASLGTDLVRSLVLYEPPAPRPEIADAVAPLRELVDNGRHEEALLAFLVGGPGESEEVIEALRQEDLWSVAIGLAPTIPLDLAALAEHSFDPHRYAGIEVPVLHLLGT